MKFGVVTHAVGHHMSFEKTLEAIKELGFDFILLLTSRGAAPVSAQGRSESPFPNVLDSDPEHVRKAIHNAGLEIGALHFSGDIDIDSDEGIEPTIGRLKEYAAYALALECKYLTHPVSSCGRSKVPTAEKMTEIKRLATCVNAVAETFVEGGLQIGVDIHHTAWGGRFGRLPLTA